MDKEVVDITPRVRNILWMLLKRNAPVPVKALAEELNVSKRTVQRELDYIAYFLAKRNLQLISKTRVGIWIEGELEDKESLLVELEDYEKEDISDKQVRKKVLITELLKDQSPRKAFYYGELLKVSETTINKDLEEIQDFFDEYQVKVVKKQGVGIYLEGKEESFRQAMIRVIAEEIEASMREDNSGDWDDASVEKGLMNKAVLQKVVDCLATISDSRLNRMTQESYMRLVIHLTIAIERIRKEEFINKEAEVSKDEVDSEEYQLAKVLTEALSYTFQIEMPQTETYYIYIYIKGSKSQKSTAIYDGKAGDIQKISDIVEALIHAYDESLIPLLKSDEDFVNGLHSHLEPTLVRLKHHMPIENIHLEEIKENYSEVYQRCVKVAKKLEELTGYQVPDTEIGFLAIHFGAAVVRIDSQKEIKRTVRIGIVCASGIGISRLMLSKLENLLKKRVQLTAYGKEELTEHILRLEDFFVSSIRMEDIETEVVYVSPLLPVKDLAEIEQRVSKYEMKPIKNGIESDFSRQLEDINKLSSAIKTLISKLKRIDLEDDVTFEESLEVIAKTITKQPGQQVQIIEDIRKREEISTQMIPELEIGLLHCITNGVYNVAMHVARPKTGEGFKTPQMQGMKVLIVLLLPNDSDKMMNRGLLGYISEQLVEDELFLKIMKEKEEEMIKGALSRVLKSYFMMMLDQV